MLPARADCNRSISQADPGVQASALAALPSLLLVHLLQRAGGQQGCALPTRGDRRQAPGTSVAERVTTLPGPFTSTQPKPRFSLAGAFRQ